MTPPVETAVQDATAAQDATASQDATALAVDTADPLDTHKAQAMLKGLSDPIRLKVIEQLGAGERCVCDLTTDLKLSQSRLSFHLKVLREAGLISDRQSGRWVYYRLRPEALGALQQWLQGLSLSCEARSSCCDG